MYLKNAKKLVNRNLQFHEYFYLFIFWQMYKNSSIFLGPNL